MSGHRFTHNDTSLFYTQSGPATAPAALLIHGWTTDQQDWAFQIPLLLLLGFRVLALDLRGHGRSPAAPSPAANPALYAPAAFAADAAALLAHANVTDTDPALVVGHSLGGLVAAMVGVEHPRLVRGVVAVDSAYYVNATGGGGAAAVLEAGRAGPDAAARLFDAGGLAEYSARTPDWMRSWHESRTLGVGADVVAAAAEGMFASDGSAGLWENAEGYLRDGFGAVEGEATRVPRLAVVADGWKVAREQDIGLGVGDRVEVLNESHWLMQQGAETFNWIVKDWLEERGFLP